MEGRWPVEKTITNTKALLGLMLLGLVLMGCQPKQESASVAVQGRTARSGSTTGGLNSSTSGISTLNGYVYADESYQDGFQDAVTGFLDASVPSEYVGFVSAMGRNNTGVFFGGRVALANGALRGATNGQVAVQTGSRILITVYDEFTGTRDQSGQTIPPIPVYLPNASGYVTGNNAYLRFADDYGWVEMQGQFDASYFRGTITWDNQRRYDGQMGSAGTLGSFEVPTCEFFQCN